MCDHLRDVTTWVIDGFMPLWVAEELIILLPIERSFAS